MPKKKNGLSCPYDKRRNGAILSEGACMIVLEDLNHAMKRKARIYAEVKGFGQAFEPDPGVSAGGATEAIRQAIDEFGYPENNIDYIVGSGNSTPYIDFIETKAIKNAFREKAKNIPVTSIKSMIGDSFSAGGAFNAAAAIGSLENDFIPPTINYSLPDKHCDLNIVANKAVKIRLNNILINSFSHNGQSSSLVIGRCDA